jgi:hypothetical protein
VLPQLDTLQLIRCSSQAELEAARRFRDEVFLERRNVAFGADLERHRDAVGHVFVLNERGVPRATARMTPYSTSLSPVLTVSPELLPDGVDSEVGRMAAVRTEQAGTYSLLTLVLGAMWMLEYADYRRYVAYCHPKLLGLYQLVGAEATEHRCDVPGRNTPHHIITGRYEDCVRRGVLLLGQDVAAARRCVRGLAPQPVELAGQPLARMSG